MNTNRITISSSDKLSLLSNLSTMMTAGIPILEAIDSLSEEAKGNLKKILESVRADLTEGKRLYTSFASYPMVFDKVTVNVMKASEEAGTLDITLKDLRMQIQKEIEFTDKIKASLAYPLLIVVVFFGVLLLILIVVIPKIALVFSRLKIVLPLPTKILIFLSSLLLTYTIPVILTVMGITTGLFFLYRLQKPLMLRVLFALPFIRNLIKEIDLTRFSRSMYLLLTSGITITTALELSEDVVMRDDIAKTISFAKETVLAGKNMSEAFKIRKNIFSNIMIKIIQAGEKTGTLDKSMQDLSEHLDYLVSNTLKSLTTLMEPILLIVVGLLVGGMMLSILVPIYSIIGQVGAR